MLDAFSYLDTVIATFLRTSYLELRLCNEDPAKSHGATRGEYLPYSHVLSPLSARGKRRYFGVRVRIGK